MGTTGKVIKFDGPGRYMPLYKKTLITSIFVSFLTTQTLSQYSFEQWEQDSKTNKALLPRYGHLAKTQEEIQSDSDYIRQIMALPQFKSRREASNHIISLGFQYYYRPDFKTAMYRFNQAYLLDSTNTDIFWDTALSTWPLVNMN